MIIDHHGIDDKTTRICRQRPPPSRKPSTKRAAYETYPRLEFTTKVFQKFSMRHDLDWKPLDFTTK